MKSMTRKRTRWMVSAGLLMTLGLFAAADTAWSQPPDGGGPRRGRMGRRPGGPSGGPGGLMIPLGRLDLSEAQWDQVRDVMEQNREALRAAGARVREVRQTLQDAIRAEELNEATVRAAAAELGTVEGDAAVQRAYVRSLILQLLTPEQQETAQAAEAEITQRMDQRRQRRDERRERRRERRERQQG